MDGPIYVHVVHEGNMFYLDALKHQKFDHTRDVATMSGEEVLKEYLYLKTGYADEQAERKGVKLGLPSQLAARLGELEGYVIACISYHLVVPA